MSKTIKELEEHREYAQADPEQFDLPGSVLLFSLHVGWTDSWNCTAIEA